MEVFDSYFKRADLDQDGKISGAEAVAFFQGSNLPKHVLAQIWTYANQNQSGFLGRPEFYNALRLITVAQSGRELTPDLVKAALFGPAAAKIPPPKINPTASPTPAQLNTTARPASSSTMAPSSPQMGALGPSSFQNPGLRGQPSFPNVGTNQQQFPPPNNQFQRPPQRPQFAGSVPAGVVGQSAGVGNMAGPASPSSNSLNLSTDLFGGRIGGTSVGATTQAPARGVAPVSQGGLGLAQPGATSGVITRPETPPTSSTQTKPLDLDMFSSQPSVNGRSLAVSGNGFSSDSGFGGNAFSVVSQPKHDTPSTAFSARNVGNSSPTVTGFQNSNKQGQLDPTQSSVPRPPVANQWQNNQSSVNHTQTNTPQSGSNVSNATPGPITSAPSGSQWPSITQSDIQKYSAVFVKVDKDRDGKITGGEARNLFLSWRLPREVLKQVWDLSDQDNDSMLSFREFCIALYLMERFREGRSLPAVLPNNLISGEMVLSTSQPPRTNSNSAWQQNQGIPHQVNSGPRPPMPAMPAGRPPRAPLPSVSEDTTQLQPPKARVPVLEESFLKQLSKEEQTALTSKFQEATDSDKKVQELEKEIIDAKEKTEFYRTKMQELVLYKSRCDNRLNEITERISADRREVELLAKKYEEKYKKQVGDVASRLSLDEATFRDIQDKKMELYNAIVKMEQGGTGDGSLKDRADQIQADLEEAVKSLNERCKQYGLRAKPTSLVELPFGWQPGIQEGSADWDGDWDKFNEEGYTIIKELTIEVENIVAKPKSPQVRDVKIKEDKVSAVQSSSKDEKSEEEKPSSDSEHTGEHVTDDDPVDVHSEDGLGKRSSISPRRNTLESSSPEVQSTHSGGFDASPRAIEPHSGGFDASPRAIETQSEHGAAESTISGDKFSDEPSWGGNFDSNDDADSIWGFNTSNTKLQETDHERNQHDSFFGADDFGLSPIRTESPSAASMYGQEKSIFFDSVPSTPMFNEPPEEHSFERFNRFDSFNMSDTGPFSSHDNSFARFDSMRSTAEPPHHTRFDSMSSSTADPPFGGGFTRFDSMRSSAAESPRGGIPSGAFTRFDSMRSTATDSPPGSFARFDSMRSTTDYNHGFPSFDDSDPFGSTGPFKSGTETPKHGTDSWRAF